MPEKKIKMVISLLLTPDLMRKLKSLAAIDRRSVSNYVAIVIERHIDGTETK